MSTISKFAGRVVCTKAQFDALAEKDPNKEYLVTDDDTYGGGKLYLHKIVASLGRQPADIYLSIINNSITSLIEDSQLQTYIGNGITAYFIGSAGIGAVGIKFDSSKNKYSVQGAISDDSSQLVSIKFLDVFGHIADTITEL